MTILIALFLTSFGGFLLKNKLRVSASDDLSLYTVLVKRGTLPGLVSASGELQAVRSVNISPEQRGLLEEIFVDIGAEVTKGQVLAKMEAGDFMYRLDEIKADYQTQKAAFERRNQLFAEGAISAEEKDDYQNRFLISKARLQQREVEGDDLFIRAPFGGIITSRYSEPGSFVAPTSRSSTSAGSTSTSIVELSQGLEIAAKVPESDIGRIRIGQKAVIRVDAFPDKRFDAKVVEIAPRAEKKDNVTSFEVTLSFLEKSRLLRIGMTADVEFKTGQTEESTLVPTVSIVTENGTPGVLLVGDKLQPKFQPVELGTSSGSQTIIINGVNPGSKIFIDMPPWAKKKRS